MKLTADQQAKLDAFLDSLGIVTVTPPTPPAVAWYKDNAGPAPAIPLANADDEEADKHYAAYGLKIDLTRGVAASDDAAMISICDGIARATSPQEAETAIKGAGFFPPDVAIYFVRTGCTQGFSPFMTPMIFAPTSIQTIREAALYAVAKWTGGSGPGPGIG